MFEGKIKRLQVILEGQLQQGTDLHTKTDKRPRNYKTSIKKFVVLAK